MYASIRRGKIKPGTIATVVPLLESGAFPILSAIPGFRAAYAVHSADDTFTAISLFADQAGAEQSNALILDWLRQNLAPLLAGPPEALLGEVVAYRE